MKQEVVLLAAGLALAGCESKKAFLFGGCLESPRVAALDAKAWDASEWISFAGAPSAPDADARNGQRAAAGTAYFMKKFVNPKKVAKAVWMTSGLGVYELAVNGVRVGDDFLKPGFTHVQKTRRSFTYDVTSIVKGGAGEENVFAAAVSSGWWRDKIVNWTGRKSAFRGVVEFTYADGTKELMGTKSGEWLATDRGPARNASIFEGEVYDARIGDPLKNPAAFADAKPSDCEKNAEFKGEILPSEGAEICLRRDLAMAPVEAYTWAGVEGASGEGKEAVFGKVKKVRTFAKREAMSVKPGETLVLDFGQNCAGVPEFAFSAQPGTTVTALPAEMLNDANGERGRGNDGPAGSVYRANLRMPETGMRAVYTFGDAKAALWHPSFTFFGYRYLSVTATDTVKIERVVSIPATSIAKEMELGKIETGDKDLNRFIQNVYWGQLSNYLSVPTDCPQRNERLGWTADTQVFAEAGAFNADTSAFFRKWMRDMRDSQDPRGGFPGVAPWAQYGNNPMRFGWADAGVIVPYQIWKQFGDRAIVDENWEAMERYLARVDETKYDFTATQDENQRYQWADWLSFEALESAGGLAFEKKNGSWAPKPDAILYWNYLGACYWAWDAQMMAAMAKGTGRDASKYEQMAAKAKAHLKKTFFDTPDGLVLACFRGMQTPALFALKLGLVEGAAKEATIAALKKNFKDHGDCLQTGFLGTSILMDVLADNGMADVAYTLLLQHKNPSWLYSVDQGATTVWERWNSYTKQDGFGPVGMNSFNHYAYGAVLAWIYRRAAGIAADPARPGFANVVMAPLPDKRLGFVKAEYRSRAGLVKSAWRYEGDKWIWDFTVPEGATASVVLPGETAAKTHAAGVYHVER
ncbi:MAG: glycoside hydrolase family 78 protein [Kiritimatiellae bacterium]|nr:glycoside hydrolase family 78 protein [Kiritimatiellia bacterium]